MRFARQDTWFEDTLIRRGDAVSVVLAAANRDPACFPDPDQLELERTPNRHLGFGLGPHYCLGAALARLEGKIGIGTLLEQLPGLQLAAPLDTLHWHTNPIMRGLRHLPVCLST
jgi:cytochrome P450 PksS